MDTHNRRAILRLSCTTTSILGLRLSALGKPEEWNRKEPAEWSEADRERILTNSPWAKKTSTARYGGSMRMGGGGAPAGGGGTTRGGWMGGDDDPGGGAMQRMEAIVCWESAAPVRIARKEQRAPVSDAYLISLTRFSHGDAGAGRMGTLPQLELGNQQQRNVMERLQLAAHLEVKGQPALQPRKVDRMGNSGEEILFSFDRRKLSITTASKEITFRFRVGPLDVRARFSPREMLFKDELSV